MKKIIASTLFLLVGLTLNAQSWWEGKKVKGNGNIVTKTRTTDDYNKIIIGGNFKVTLIDGKEGNIKVTGDENVIPYLITKVINGNLEINYKKNTNIKPTKRLKIVIPFKKIASISLAGAGDIISNKVINSEKVYLNVGGSGSITTKLESSYLKVNIGGSGEVNVSGNTTKLVCSLAGSGNIEAYSLKAKKLNASLAGSGNLKVNVSNEINANIVGSGNIYYKGNPKHIDSNAIGSGEMINRN